MPQPRSFSANTSRQRRKSCLRQGITQHSRERSTTGTVLVPIAITDRGPLDHPVIGVKTPDLDDFVLLDAPINSEQQFRSLVGL